MVLGCPHRGDCGVALLDRAHTSANLPVDDGHALGKFDHRAARGRGDGGQRHGQLGVKALDGLVPIRQLANDIEHRLDVALDHRHLKEIGRLGKACGVAVHDLVQQPDIFGLKLAKRIDAFGAKLPRQDDRVADLLARELDGQGMIGRIAIERHVPLALDDAGDIRNTLALEVEPKVKPSFVGLADRLAGSVGSEYQGRVGAGHLRVVTVVARDLVAIGQGARGLTGSC